MVENCASGVPPVKTIAFISTVCFPISHCDVMLSRWNLPRAGDEEWGWGRSEVRAVSLYVAQHPENDISGLVAEAQRVTIYATIEDALTLGTGTVAVDGVALIAEHGDFPDDERGVKLYPRKEMFDEIIRVLDASGKRIPIFCDKGLSWNRGWAIEMVEACKVRGIPIFAGSSGPYGDCVPELPARVLDEPEESLSVFFAGEEIYGFHSIEGSLSYLEQRPGGEAGIRALRVLRDDAAFAEINGEPGLNALFRASLAAMDLDPDTIPRESYTRTMLFTFEHEDGLRSHHFHADGVLKRFLIAIRSKSGEIAAARSAGGGSETHYAHFATLNRMIERMVATGKASAPIERTLLSTLALSRVMDLHFAGGGPDFVPTPELGISYQPLRRPRYARSAIAAEWRCRP